MRNKKGSKTDAAGIIVVVVFVFIFGSIISNFVGIGGRIGGAFLPIIIFGMVFITAAGFVVGSIIKTARMSSDVRKAAAEVFNKAGVSINSGNKSEYSYKAVPAGKNYGQSPRRPTPREGYVFSGTKIDEDGNMTLKERRKLRLCEDGRMHCPYCGGHVRENDEYCKTCRKQLLA